MHPSHEQERGNFQRDLDALPDDNTITLMPREYPGPVTIDHPLVIDGRGCTVWALKGPVISCDADGVTLRDLSIEVTGATETGRVEDHCALKVSPGCGITLENIEVRGSVSGLWQEEGDWQYPYSLHIGSIPFSSELDLILRVWVPVPCEITSKISGVLVQPQKLEPGANEITLHIERIAKDTLLNGILSIRTPNLKRSISVSGYISAARPKKPKSKQTMRVVWQPDEWERLVAMPRPALPTPPPTVAPPPRRSRPIPPPTQVPDPPPPPPVSVPLPPPPHQPPSKPIVVPPPVPVPPPPPPVLPPGPSPVPGPKPFYRKPIVIGLGAICVLALIGLSYWLFRSGSPLDPDKITGLHQLYLDSEALTVAFSPDGKTLASGSKAGAVQLWTVSSGKPASQQLPARHQSAVNSVAFSHNGKLLASGSADNYVILWDMDQNGLKQRIGLGDEVFSVAFSIDDATLACGIKDGTVRFVDTTSGQQQSIRLTPGTPVRAVAFSPDGKLVATGAEDGTVKIWEVTTKGMKQQLSPKHDGPVLALAFANNDANILATGGADAKLVLWDLEKRQMKSPSPFPHRDQVTSVAFSSDDKLLVSGGGGRDTTIRFWSTQESSTVKRVLVDHSGAVNAVAISSGGIVASGSSDRTVRLWATP